MEIFKIINNLFPMKVSDAMEYGARKKAKCSVCGQVKEVTVCYDPEKSKMVKICFECESETAPEWEKKQSGNDGA